MLKITILGCYAATPRTFSNPTSQVVEVKNHVFLLDCAEGTQVQLRRNKVKFSKIEHIFISHLHGDHFFGLIGLVSTFMLLGRTAPLHIYGPKGIKEIILLQLRHSGAWTPYELHFHELSSAEPELILEDEKITVHTIPLNHRIYTNGFLIREKVGLRKLNIAAAERFGVEKLYYRNIVLGKDIKLADGRVISNIDLTFEADPPKSYAYCSDTAYHEPIYEQVSGVTAMYHEATFLESEREIAARTMHATAKDAARIAKKAGVGSLILGHYSTRYDDLSAFEKEASELFSPVLLADDGRVFEL